MLLRHRSGCSRRQRRRSPSDLDPAAAPPPPLRCRPRWLLLLTLLTLPAWPLAVWVHLSGSWARENAHTRQSVLATSSAIPVVWSGCDSDDEDKRLHFLTFTSVPQHHLHACGYCFLVLTFDVWWNHGISVCCTVFLYSLPVQRASGGSSGAMPHPTYGHSSCKQSWPTHTCRARGPAMPCVGAH